MTADRRHSPISKENDGVTVAVRVQPGARSSGIGGAIADADDRYALKIAVTSAPEGGKANAAVVALLSKSWRDAKGSITIEAGAAARRKILRIKGDPADLKITIEASMKETGNG